MFVNPFIFLSLSIKKSYFYTRVQVSVSILQKWLIPKKNEWENCFVVLPLSNLFKKNKQKCVISSSYTTFCIGNEWILMITFKRKKMNDFSISLEQIHAYIYNNMFLLISIYTLYNNIHVILLEHFFFSFKKRHYYVSNKQMVVQSHL